MPRTGILPVPRKAVPLQVSGFRLSMPFSNRGRYFHDLPECLRIQRSPADEPAVDVRLFQEIPRVRRFHGSSVNDARRCGAGEE